MPSEWRPQQHSSSHLHTVLPPELRLNTHFKMNNSICGFLGGWVGGWLGGLLLPSPDGCQTIERLPDLWKGFKDREQQDWKASKPLYLINLPYRRRLQTRQPQSPESALCSTCVRFSLSLTSNGLVFVSIVSKSVSSTFKIYTGIIIFSD